MIQNVWDPDMLGLEVAKRGGNELYVFCPYHSDSNPSAEYNVRKGLFYCFGCQTSKTARELADDLGGSLVPVAVEAVVNDMVELEDSDWRNLLRNPLAVSNPYLESRGVSQDLVLRFSIRASSTAIVFPLYHLGSSPETDAPGGVQIRQLGGKKPKYKLYGERPYVWPSEILLQRKHEPLFVTEGVFGALRGLGFGANAVAMLGASSAEKTANFFRKFGAPKVYAVMDGDEAGLLAAGKFTLLGIPALVWPRGSAQAPDDASEKEWGKIVQLTRFTTDVNDIIAMSAAPGKLQKSLESFWRKL